MSRSSLRVAFIVSMLGMARPESTMVAPDCIYLSISSTLRLCMCPKSCLSFSEVAGLNASILLRSCPHLATTLLMSGMNRLEVFPLALDLWSLDLSPVIRSCACSRVLLPILDCITVDAMLLMRCSMCLGFPLFAAGTCWCETLLFMPVLIHASLLLSLHSLIRLVPLSSMLNVVSFGLSGEGTAR